MKIKDIDLTNKTIECPVCGSISKRHSSATRLINDLGFSEAIQLRIKFNKYFCEECCKYFSFPMSDLAKNNCKFTNRVKTVCANLVVREGLKYKEAVRYMKKEYFVNVPLSNIGDWVSAWKKKGELI